MGIFERRKNFKKREEPPNTTHRPQGKGSKPKKTRGESLNKSMGVHSDRGAYPPRAPPAASLDRRNARTEEPERDAPRGHPHTTRRTHRDTQHTLIKKPRSKPESPRIDELIVVVTAAVVPAHVVAATAPPPPSARRLGACS